MIPHRLSNVAELRVSTVDKHTVEGEQEVKLCNYVDVYKNHEIVDGLEFMSASATQDEVDRFTIESGDTLFTKDSETADDIGIPAFVRETERLVCGYHVAIARPNRATVHPRYLYWCLASEAAAQQWAVLATGVTRVGLRRSDIGKLSLMVPDLHMQKQIVEFLDRETAKTDTLIAKQQMLVASLLERRAALIAEAVDYPPDGRRLKHLVRSIRQGWSPECEQVPADGVTEWGILKAGCMNGGSFRPQENKRLPEDVMPRPDTAVRQGEIVLSRASTRELVGSAALVDCEYPRLMLSDKIYALHIDHAKAEAEFVTLLLGTSRIRSRIELAATGASHSMQNISKEDILNLPTTVPSLNEQRGRLKELSVDVGRLRRAVEEARGLVGFLRERRGTLVTAAVTGQIDVVTYGRAESAESFTT